MASPEQNKGPYPIQEVGLRHPIEKLPFPETEEEVSRIATMGMESIRRIKEITDRNFMRTARFPLQPEIEQE